MSEETVEICMEVFRETDNAVLLSDGGEPVWLPKSLIEGDAGYECGDTCDIIMPIWLAEKNGLV